MANTQAETVFDAVKVALEAILTSASPAYNFSVKVVHPELLDACGVRQQGGLPAICMMHKASRFKLFPSLVEMNTMELILVAYIEAGTDSLRKTRIENFADDIKRAIYTDVTFGQTAIEATVTRQEDNKSNPDVMDPAGGLAEILLAVDVVFERELTWS